MSSSAGRLRGSGLSPRRFVADVGPVYAANGLIGLLLAATAPTAIILSVSTGAHMPASELVSWIFGIFFPTG
jgi:benzoate membrane transport protein